MATKPPIQVILFNITFKNMDAALTTRDAHAPMTNSEALLGVAVLFSTSK